MMSAAGNQSNWRGRLRLRLEDFVDEFVVDGAAHDEVFDAIVAETAVLRQALEHDPDPAPYIEDGTVVTDPANDWPAAT